MSTSCVAIQSSAWLSMLSSTCSVNARNSVSVIIQPATITELPVSHMAFSHRVFRIVATLSATGLIAACGYKGPLYMPVPSDQQGSSGAKPPSAQTENRPRIPTNPNLP
ncbi:LPS translocon maturation chaperone LptM [Bordetella hinzii]|uniref:LPS translocon maturation chaperone LptM n=2 Tax=Bordetella hinzii TaxID=103855 RepID=UPI0032E48BD9